MLEKHSDIHQCLKEITDTSTTTMNENSTLEIINIHNKIKSVLLSVNFRTLQSNFDESLKNQAQVFGNYTKVFEHLFLLLRATRQQIWTLYLTSVHALYRYFFAYDMINYARFTPVYLAQMFVLKEKDEQTWNFLNNGNFSVNKSSIVYTGLGADHALEQANKTMKIRGGIKGIASNQLALDQFFIIAPEISSIIEKVYTIFGITDSDDQEHHYQLKGGKNKRISDNVEKLTTVFDHHNTNFEESDCVYNTVTKKILPEKFAKVFLNHEQEGEKRLQEFTNGRIEGNVSI